MSRSTQFLILLFVLLSLGIVGVIVYVAVSFGRMLRYTVPRPWRRMLWEALREAWWVLLTQPFLPFFYISGRRFSSEASGRPIVFIHGYAQNRVAFWWLARGLAKKGLGPLFAINYPWFLPISSVAVRLGFFLEGVRAETGCLDVDLVCHSMGGLVALEYLRQMPTKSGVRRCVTIATPHGGVGWQASTWTASGRQLHPKGEFLRALMAAPLDVPVLSIFSTHDNVVHPPETSALQTRGGRDEIIDGGGHLSLLFHPGVLTFIADFLCIQEVASATVAVASTSQQEQSEQPVPMPSTLPAKRLDTIGSDASS